MIIKEVKCKSVMVKTGLPADYCINPYTGCSHACKYCYASFMKKYTNHKEPWGEFVDVKVNALEVLRKELKTKRGSVILSSVTDPYQPLEAKYELTRGILKELLDHQFELSVLTKSSLVLRDLDIIKKFKKAEVGMTITCLNDGDAKIFEPAATPPSKRIRALKRIWEEGVKTYVFFGPIIPYVSDKDLKGFFRMVSFADYVLVDRLNIKSGNWPRIEETIKKHKPELLQEYKEIFFGKNNYYAEIKRKIKELASENNVSCKICY